MEEIVKRITSVSLPVATTSSPSSGLTFMRAKVVRQITASSRAPSSFRLK